MILDLEININKIIIIMFFNWNFFISFYPTTRKFPTLWKLVLLVVSRDPVTVHKYFVLFIVIKHQQNTISKLVDKIRFRVYFLYHCRPPPFHPPKKQAPCAFFAILNIIWIPILLFITYVTLNLSRKSKKCTNFAPLHNILCIKKKVGK